MIRLYYVTLLITSSQNHERELNEEMGNIGGHNML